MGAYHNLRPQSISASSSPLKRLLHSARTKGTLRDITYYIAALFCIPEHKLTFVSLNSTLLQLDIVSKRNRYQGMLISIRSELRASLFVLRVHVAQ